MKDYSKLTKKQLVALLEQIENELDGCIEEAQQRAEEYAREEERKYQENHDSSLSCDTKYPYMYGVLQSRILWVLDDLAKA